MRELAILPQFSLRDYIEGEREREKIGFVSITKH